MTELHTHRRGVALLALRTLCLVAGVAAAMALLIGLQRLNAGMLGGPAQFGLGVAALVVGLARLFPPEGREVGFVRLAGGAAALAVAAALMLVGGLGAAH